MEALFKFCLYLLLYIPIVCVPLNVSITTIDSTSTPTFDISIQPFDGEQSTSTNYDKFLQTVLVIMAFLGFLAGTGSLVKCLNWYNRDLFKGAVWTYDDGVLSIKMIHNRRVKSVSFKCECEEGKGHVTGEENVERLRSMYSAEVSNECKRVAVTVTDTINRRKKTEYYDPQRDFKTPSGSAGDAKMSKREGAAVREEAENEDSGNNVAAVADGQDSVNKEGDLKTSNGSAGDAKMRDSKKTTNYLTSKHQASNNGAAVIEETENEDSGNNVAAVADGQDSENKGEMVMSSVRRNSDEDESKNTETTA